MKTPGVFLLKKGFFYASSKEAQPSFGPGDILAAKVYAPKRLSFRFPSAVKLGRAKFSE